MCVCEWVCIRLLSGPPHLLLLDSFFHLSLVNGHQFFFTVVHQIVIYFTTVDSGCRAGWYGCRVPFRIERIQSPSPKGIPVTSCTHLWGVVVVVVSWSTGFSVTPGLMVPVGHMATVTRGVFTKKRRLHENSNSSNFSHSELQILLRTGIFDTLNGYDIILLYVCND